MKKPNLEQTYNPETKKPNLEQTFNPDQDQEKKPHLDLSVMIVFNFIIKIVIEKVFLFVVCIKKINPLQL